MLPNRNLEGRHPHTYEAVAINILNTDELVKEITFNLEPN
jgi:hypothetical protein